MIMTKLWSTIKIHVHIVIVLLLLIHEPANKLVEGQLEAVGAVLSVVPVTSILATAGLVGVKLAALSRLLDLLGYDRAYLAQGGSGTAAHPIGLQTKYAYMFPYVPGLNISVRGEDSIGMQEATVSGGIPQRKTYPAMSLPGDYEQLQKPFRGSEALQTILQQAGMQVHTPTIQQQQQLQQAFNLPPEAGKRTVVIELPAGGKQPASSEQQQQGSASGLSKPAGLSSQLEQSTKARDQAMQTAARNQNPVVVKKTFGMPALNIHSLRRRRRHSFTGPAGILEQKLRNGSGRTRRHVLARAVTAAK